MWRVLVVLSIAGCQAPPSPSPSPTATRAIHSARPAIPAPSPSSTPRPIAGRIAYAHNAGEPGGVPETDIWIVDANGGEPKALTSGPENESGPFWLMDGSRLVFAVFDYAKNPYYGRLVSVSPDGSDRQDLAPVANYDESLVSPDGRYVAWGGGGLIDGSDGITLLDRSTGEARLLTTDGATDPIWAPDGRALLVREYLLGAVAVVEVPSGRLTRFEKAGISEVLGWTADGRSIVFSGPQEGDTTTWMAPAAGGSIVAFPGTTDMAWPSWTSPDGQWIVDPRLEVQPADGGRVIELASGLRMLTGAPSWSVDSGAMTFAGSTLDELGDRTSAIYVVSLDTKEPTRITSGPLDTSPSWDPSST